MLFWNDFCKQKCDFCVIFVDFCILDHKNYTNRRTALLIFASYVRRCSEDWFLLRWFREMSICPPFWWLSSTNKKFTKIQKFTKINRFGEEIFNYITKTLHFFEVWILRQLIFKNGGNLSG